MMPLLFVKALVMGVVEGLTEFLPVSSTGHLVIAGTLLGLNNEKGKVFEIVIQTGAMLAIVWVYWDKLVAVLLGLLSRRDARQFAVNIAIAFMPAAILGLAFGKYIKTHLFAPVPVALAFIVGGVVILWVERRPHAVTVHSVDDMRWLDALKVGCAQCLALVPGTSRSGATIIGGLLFGLSRQAATEFSFFLAIPTLVAAGLYDVYKGRALLSAADAGWFGVGLVAAFLSALVCVKWLIRYISRHDFGIFAWYRIAMGVVVLVVAYTVGLDWSGR